MTTTTTIISGYHGIFWEQIARNWDEYGMEWEFEVFWFIGTTIGICLSVSKWIGNARRFSWTEIISVVS